MIISVFPILQNSISHWLIHFLTNIKTAKSETKKPEVAKAKPAEVIKGGVEETLAQKVEDEIGMN